MAGITIFDKYKTEKIEEMEYRDFDAVPAFTKEQLEFKLPVELPPDEYWANVRVYGDDGVVKEEDVVFRVDAQSTSDKSSVKTFHLMLYLVIGMLMIIIAFMIYRKCPSSPCNRRCKKKR